MACLSVSFRKLTLKYALYRMEVDALSDHNRKKKLTTIYNPFVLYCGKNVDLTYMVITCNVFARHKKTDTDPIHCIEIIRKHASFK